MLEKTRGHGRPEDNKGLSRLVAMAGRGSKHSLNTGLKNARVIRIIMA